MLCYLQFLEFAKHGLQHKIVAISVHATARIELIISRNPDFAFNMHLEGIDLTGIAGGANPGNAVGHKGRYMVNDAADDRRINNGSLSGVELLDPDLIVE